MRHLRTIRAVIAVTVTAGILTACSTTPAPPKPKPPVSYYVALGDSLSLGVQPNADGVTVPTEQGYPDQLYATLHRNRPGLRLVHLGCSGETTKTMLNGGICQYPGGSQLAAATPFLRAHRGHVFLVTIDIGANDLEDCGSQSNLIKVISCFVTDVPGAVSRLGTIMARLRSASGPSVR